jgi:hypothetical protein
MPRFDGTGPRGAGMFTGRGEGYCVLRLPEQADEPAVGYAGVEGNPVQLPPSVQPPRTLLVPQSPVRPTSELAVRGRRNRCGRRRCAVQRQDLG